VIKEAPVKKLLILSTAALLAAVLIICSAGCVDIQTSTGAGQTIEIGVGEEFYIALGSNPTTGYSWQASYDQAMLELIGGQSEYRPSEEGVIGGGGIEFFHFLPLQAGETEITLTYQQPWPGGGIGETKVFTVIIVD
jgi:inhibitor of cysteine peptidase